MPDSDRYGTVRAIQRGELDPPPMVQVMLTGTSAWAHWRALFAEELDR